MRITKIKIKAIITIIFIPLYLGQYERIINNLTYLMLFNSQCKLNNQ